MANTTARIKKTGKNFEIIVDLDDALKFKIGLSAFIQAETEFIFKDIKKAEKASENELKDCLSENFPQFEFMFNRLLPGRINVVSKDKYLIGKEMKSIGFTLAFNYVGSASS
jgi:hypothetical protein